MKSFAHVAVLFACLVAMAGCETLGQLLESRAAIEPFLAAQVAGEYTVTFTKDGKAIYTEQWTCTQGSDNKLSGCHKK